MWLVLASLFVLGGAACQSRLFRLRGAAAVLGVLLLAVAQVVMVSFLLAALGAYRAGPVVLVCALSAVVSALACCVTAPGLPIGRPHWRPRRPASELGWAASAMALLVLLHLAIRLVFAVRLAPFGYDALSYHLAAVGWLVQEGRLPGPDAGVFVSGYPLGGELIAAWPAVLLHNDVLSRVPQVLMAAFGGLSTALLARAVGATRPASVLAGSLFVLTPALLAQSMTAYVDVTAASLIVCTCAFLLRWVTGRAAGTELALAGMAGGLALGTKQVTVIFLTVAFLGVVVVARRQGRPVIRSAAVFAAPAALAGGCWYVKNWIVHGNPAYPIPFLGLPGAARLGDLVQQAPGPKWPEPVPTLWSWGHDVLPRLYVTYEERSGGLGAVFVWVGLPCLVAVGVLSLRRRDVAWGVLLWLTVATFAVQPYRWWARFTFPLAAAAAVAVATLLSPTSDEVVSRRRPVAFGRLLLAATVVGVLAAQPGLFLRTVSPTDGSPPRAAWEALSAPSGSRLGGQGGTSLAGIERARVVAVAVDEVGRTGSLFGSDFQRRIRPVATSDRAAFVQSLHGADVLVACGSSQVGRWASQDPEHLRRLSPPAAALAVWRVNGTPLSSVTSVVDADPGRYCT